MIDKKNIDGVTYYNVNQVGAAVGYSTFQAALSNAGVTYEDMPLFKYTNKAGQSVNGRYATLDTLRLGAQRMNRGGKKGSRRIMMFKLLDELSHTPQPMSQPMSQPLSISSVLEKINNIEPDEDVIPPFDGEHMTSMEIAVRTKMLHKSVIYEIEQLLSAGVSGLEFLLTSYTDKQGKQRKAYKLTKFGCIALGGKLSTEIYVKILNRWKELEEMVHKPQYPSNDIFGFMQATLDTMRNQSQRISNVEIRIEAIEDERKVAGQLLMQADISDIKPISEKKDRARLNELVREYADATNTPHNEVWNMVRKEHLYRYHGQYKNIDEAEQRGYLPNCLSIIADKINQYRNRNSISCQH